MSDRAEFAYWLRNVGEYLVPYLQKLPDYLDEMDEHEQRLASIKDEIVAGNSVIDELNAKIAKLDELAKSREHEAETIRVEGEANARRIIAEAEARAAELIQAAEAKAGEVRQSADEYAAKVMERLNRMKEAFAA